MQVEDQGQKVNDPIHDWDTKFTAQFDAFVNTRGVEVNHVGPKKPNMNAYAERFAQTIQHECLDHFTGVQGV